MDIDQLTYAELKQIAALFNPQSTFDHPFEIGANYLIRTVTMIDTGRVVKVTPQWVLLEDAAWIADTGRFADALEAAEFDEVEPFPNGVVGIGIGAIVDFCKIKKTPRKQK